MKTIRLVVAVCAALMIAVPALALEIDVSGHYFIEAFNNSNETLRESDATNDYGRMEFMAKPVFKINENITLTTQFTALQGHVWGEPFGNSVVYNPSSIAGDWDLIPYREDDPNDFEWKAAYMTIKTGIGGFIVGRYIDTPWGTGLGDSTASHGKNSRHKDRAMWVLPIGDTVSGLVAQQNMEGDIGNDISDGDFRKYYAFSAYKQENWSTGLLIARYLHKSYINQRDLRNFQTGVTNYSRLADEATTARGTYTGTYNTILQQSAAIPGATALVQAAPFDATASATLDAALGGFGFPAVDLYGLNSAAISAEGAAAIQGAAIADGPQRSELGLWVLNPYFMGAFGPFYAEAEILYGFGEVELDVPRFRPDGSRFDEIDAEGLAATLDLKYDIAGFTFNAGTTYVEGDSDPDDDKTSAIGYFEQSIDLEHGFLLTSDISELNYGLGGTDENGIPLGNVAGGPTTITGPAGYQSFWLGAKYQLLDNLKLGLLYVKSKADDAPRTNAGVEWDDDHGSEYDFTVEWDIMNNLKFWGVVAHLDAGDYWKAGGFNTDLKDNTTFYGRLTVEF